MTPTPASASTICASVKIEIQQELTFEREGFEARLGVSNSTPDVLDDFAVVLKFSDGSGAPVASYSLDQVDNPPAGAKFFFREQPGLETPGSIAAGVTANAAYLIVPAPGAALDPEGNEMPQGTLYFVGATVTYKVGGQTQIVEVLPDSITVFPMPDLELQYFLPGAVYGDDPLTPGSVEPLVPFALGVRVLNNSQTATARSLNIESGQPAIIENQLGLMIEFRIIGSEVNDQPVQPTLLAALGDVQPQRSSMAAWLMTSSLTGAFVSFEGRVSHATEFGGDLTSLIPEDAISTHRLVGQVLVDFPGRDSIRDFLATPAMTGPISSITLHESDTSESSVSVPMVASPSISATGPDQASLSLGAVGSSTVYAQVTSPVASIKTVTASRSDGKSLPTGNAWISKARNEQLEDVYTLHLFDTFTDPLADATYTLTFSDWTPSHQPPELTISPSGTVQVSTGAAFTVNAAATDPGGLIPTLTTGLLPPGSTFHDNMDGTGLFTWTPAENQIGEYFVQFRATNPSGQTDTELLHVVVSTGSSSAYDDWASTHWPGVSDPAITGPSANPDGDDLDNLMEYALGGDPTQPDDSVLPVISIVEETGDKYLVLTFRQRTDDPALLYKVMSSNDAFAALESWVQQDTVLTTVPTDPASSFQVLSIRDEIPLLPEAGERYLRLVVEQTDED